MRRSGWAVVLALAARSALGAPIGAKEASLNEVDPCNQITKQKDCKRFGKTTGCVWNSEEKKCVEFDAIKNFETNGAEPGMRVKNMQKLTRHLAQRDGGTSRRMSQGKPNDAGNEKEAEVQEEAEEEAAIHDEMEVRKSEAESNKHKEGGGHSTHRRLRPEA